MRHCWLVRMQSHSLPACHTSMQMHKHAVAQLIGLGMGPNTIWEPEGPWGMDELWTVCGAAAYRRQHLSCIAACIAQPL